MATVELENSTDKRAHFMSSWLQANLDEAILSIKPLAGDASFRRYFRVKTHSAEYVLMDAPPSHEDCRPFVAVARSFAAMGLKVPEIVAEDIKQGFLLLSDFGDTLYLLALKRGDVDGLYHRAMETLYLIQQIKQDSPYHYPAYDRAYLMEELNFFTQWCLQSYLGLNLTDEQQAMLMRTYNVLVDSAAEQPQVCVHRDYHSRNLMVLADKQVGVIDFQDAMWGPVSYDLVSLLRDCYISWPRPRVESWVRAFYQDHPSLDGVACEQFLCWFDLMGVQRHLKAIYRFAIKYCRDGSSAYLQDIPRSFNYILDVCSRYPSLAEFNQFLRSEVITLLGMSGK